jgi:hypothetical protein
MRITNQKNGARGSSHISPVTPPPARRLAR